MNPEYLQKLPPEMQERLANIIAGQKPQATEQVAPEQPAAPPAPPKPPSLMDHVIALRQEVNALRQEVAAASQQTAAAAQVTDAVGQAVGQLYAMFQPSPQANAQSPTYSESFQNSVEDDY